MPDRQLRTSVYIAASVDGYIARENGDLDWLAVNDGNEPGRPGEDYGYAAFFATVDAMVMGRGTYEKVLTFGEWPYGRTPVVVLSSRPLDVPDRLAQTVTVSSASPREIVAGLAKAGHRHAYVDGGRTIQGFLADGLLDRLIVSRIPVLLGSGKPLFGRLPSDVQLRHVRTQHWPTGLVQSEYEIVR